MSRCRNCEMGVGRLRKENLEIRHDCTYIVIYYDPGTKTIGFDIDGWSSRDFHTRLGYIFIHVPRHCMYPRSPR